MRLLLFLLLVTAATPSWACSCHFDRRTLEERIDAADRVLRVRVVEAALINELVQPDATPYDRFRSERIVYQLRSIETLKGEDPVPPRLLGQAGPGDGDCTTRLAIGMEIIVMIERGQREIAFNYCHQPFLEMELPPEIDLRLKAIREFVRDRAVIHDCDNLLGQLPDRTPECQARRSAAIREWRAKHKTP